MNMRRQYGVILADPAWRYQNKGNGAAENHYPTMTTEEICQLSVGELAAANCVLVLWVTWPMLGDAWRVMEAWGFSYVTGFPWIKLSQPAQVTLWGELDVHVAYGTGIWARGCSEPVLIARRGNPQSPDTCWAGILGERMQHSRKPESVYHYCESIPGPYLELFARRRRPGWAVWGNEVESDVKLAA